MENNNQEHEHHHVHQKKESLIATSIIVSAILIAVSIFYNTKLVLEQMDGGGKLQAQAPIQVGSPTAQVPSEPTGPVKVASRKDAPVLGKSSAKVEIVEFTDFQCPFCQRFFKEAYKQIKEKYVDTGKAKIVFRHYPLPFHSNAQKAGEAAECANRQGRFVQYHDVLFEKMQADGTGLDAESLKTYAKDLGLNASKFNQCLDGGETTEIVKKDMEEGQTAGVSGTPTFFVNGVKLVGAQPFSSFEQAIEAELKK